MELTFSKATQGLKSSAVREILKLTQGKSVLSFAGGLPADELFPVDAMREAMERVFAQGSRCLQYGLTEGFTPLREQIAARLERKGIHASIDHMLLTTGSQQVIDLLAKVVADPGDVVLVENPTYLAALQVFHTYQLQTAVVDGDDDGMYPEALREQIIRHKPKLIYVTPTFSNPAGRAWSEERRRSLALLAKEYGVLVIEDDPYGDIQFNPDDRFPPVFTFDPDGERGNVLYTSTFSKTVAPAVRTGFVVGNPQVVQMMTRAKQAADLHSSTIDQQLLHQLLAHFDLDAHIRLIRDEYGRRMRRMADLLAAQRLPGLSWKEPRGGMFFWAKLPEEIDAELLLPLAVAEGVAFVPGIVFQAAQPQPNTMRLNFTHTNDEEMALGFERLARAIRNYSAEGQTPNQLPI